MGKKSVSVQPIREYIMDVMRFEHPIKSAAFFCFSRAAAVVAVVVAALHGSYTTNNWNSN